MSLTSANPVPGHTETPPKGLWWKTGLKSGNCCGLPRTAVCMPPLCAARSHERALRRNSESELPAAVRPTMRVVMRSRHQRLERNQRSSYPAGAEAPAILGHPNGTAEAVPSHAGTQQPWYCSSNQLLRLVAESQSDLATTATRDLVLLLQVDRILSNLVESGDAASVSFETALGHNQRGELFRNIHVRLLQGAPRQRAPSTGPRRANDRLA